MATGTTGVASRTRNKDTAHCPADNGGIAPPALPQSHQPTNSDIQKSIHDLASTLCGKIDKLTREVSGLSDKLMNLEQNVEFNSNKLRDIETTELPILKAKMKEEIQKMEDKMLSLEIYNRKQNLLIYGVHETESEDTYTTVRKAFKELGMENGRAENMPLINVHRLPRRLPHGQNTQPRSPTPIIARFAAMADRDHVLSLFQRQIRSRTIGAGPGGLQPTPTPAPASRISVRTDLPPVLKQRRGILANEAYKLRKERGLSTRIIVQGTSVILQWKNKGTSTWNNHQEWYLSRQEKL